MRNCMVVRPHYRKGRGRGIVGAQSGALGGGIGKWCGLNTDGSGLRTVSQSPQPSFSEQRFLYQVLSHLHWPLPQTLFFFSSFFFFFLHRKRELEKNGQRSKPARPRKRNALSSLKVSNSPHSDNRSIAIPPRFAHLRSSGTVCVRSAWHVPLFHSLSARVDNCTSLESLSVNF